MKIIEKIENVLEEALEMPTSTLGKWTDRILLGLIFFSTGIFILETTSLEDQYGPLFHEINYVIMWIFTVEYLFRLLVHKNKLKYLTSFFAIIDFIVLGSFYFLFLELPFLRALRLFRTFLILKTIRHSNLMRSFFATFKHYNQELKIFAVSLFLVLLMSSTSMYYLEHGINEKFASIPHALWWGVVTVSTVGYGDVVPLTISGKVVASLVMFMEVATVAILTALVTKVFIDHFFGKKVHICKVCNYPHHDYDAKFCKNCGTQLDIRKMGEKEDEKE